MAEEKKPAPRQVKKPTENKKPTKADKAREGFKKRYFEFYDDIKISDRQDW